MTNRKIKNIIYLLPAFLLALGAFISPPDKWLPQLKANLDTYRTQYAPEKVYLTLDKPYYAPGQSIWLKGYVREAGSLRPSGKSGVLYVDLLNTENKAVEQLTLKIVAGKAIGDIALPTDLPAGQYHLIAYTQYQRNFGEENFYNQAIDVVGTTTASQKNATTNYKIELQFFPEGGDLIAGLPSRVAFKAINPNGTGVPVEGTVFDNQGQKVLDFKDVHLGMGSFELLPQAGKNYLAKVTVNGKILDYALPIAQPGGYVLRVEETPDFKNWQITVTSQNTPAEPLILTGLSRDALLYSEKINVRPGQPTSVKVNNDKFATGIVRFTLSKSNGEPIAERLTFADNHDDLQITLTSDKKTYAGRDQVTMQVTAQDNAGKPVATDLALAVTDEELVKQPQNALNLKAYFFLTSDLKGQVEQPGYYFAGNDLARKQALDNLLLTQGWRRFNWQEIATGKFPQLNFPAETDLAISGKLVTNKGKAVEGGEALLYLQGQHQTFITTETGKNGEFSFPGFDFTGTIDVVVQGTDARGRRDRLQVKMDDKQYVPAIPAFSVPSWSDGLLASTNKDFIVASQQQMASAATTNSNYTLRSILLSSIEVKGEKDVFVPFKLHDKADVVINRRELPIAPSGNIIESLQGRVAGLQVYRVGQNQFRASIRGQQNSPLYLLDGMPILEGTVSGISQFDISRIEILKNTASAAIYGGRASGGVIALFTDRNNDEPKEVTPGTYIIIHHAKGYSKVREFYSPKYNGTTPASNEPDLRTTLYWNPSVKTNAQGKATVTFYTTDCTTSYRAQAEGISDEGKPGRGEVLFQVNSKKDNS
ncbi:TonB-dependent receptor plug domain-containing protein [Adhaeribacter swui]|uniref:TonB-dependent receptor plug domain-containing protein n=1 Tax=Adhaeribacter swui TaxID=2086471 RepID=A0A7G7GC11_9BACT|nr:TonB-dependent receptor plug domain-containing protein [Adhaeribacter swui]QNF34695.1 TonB-dependent receptor plug domain-containing protein [Adhaeribacter swui]